MNHISFAAFDDFQRAYECGMTVRLSHFRAETTNADLTDDDESARVLLTANDGNDYAIIESVGGDSFWFIAITNRVDGFGDFIAFREFNSYRDALNAMVEMSAIDYEG